ncbi:NAD(P)-binding protein [Rhizodiscina lignyota]|uniref:NAD(P)-binding protein n=1 Tax=Rhizodiscina lignyota TaxID=1504668 RepID=A0A9P4IFB2_9PEZI|nr:NAD(P)-binding protein [Rhizodiscina lignyota]
MDKILHPFKHNKSMDTKTIVLITGANSGIGYAATEKFIKNKDFHVIMACRSTDKAQAALKQLESKKEPGSMSPLQLDITSQDSIDNAVKHVTDHFGRVDVLINNAGIIAFESTLIENLRKTFETNIFAPMLITYAFLPLLEASKAATPRLVYVSSDLGSVTLRRDPSYQHYKVPSTPYRMSKASLDMLAACNEEEFARTKGAERIKVYVFNPGYTVSNLSGPEGVEIRKSRGAASPEDSGVALVDISMGKRDADQEKGMINKKGWYPW